MSFMSILDMRMYYFAGGIATPPPHKSFLLAQACIGWRRGSFPRRWTRGATSEQKHREAKSKKHDSPPKIDVHAERPLITRRIPEQAVRRQNNSQQRKQKPDRKANINAHRFLLPENNIQQNGSGKN